MGAGGRRRPLRLSGAKELLQWPAGERAFEHWAGAGERWLRQLREGAGENDQLAAALAPAAQWVRENAELLRTFFFIFFVAMMTNDASHNALGSSNGKFISLVDTIYGVAGFRAALPQRADRGDGGTNRAVWVVGGSLWAKFAAQTVVSFLLGTTPVILKGPRHILSFFAGLALVWFSPDDVVYFNMRNSLPVKLMVSTACGLYKLRKALYAVEAAAATYYGQNVALRLVLAFIVVLISLDGNTVMRRVALYVEDIANSPEPVPPLTMASIDRVMTNFAQESAIPIALLTCILCGLRNNMMVEIRIMLLMYFVNRSGAFKLLADIHKLGLAGKVASAPAPPASAAAEEPAEEEAATSRPASVSSSKSRASSRSNSAAEAQPSTKSRASSKASLRLSKASASSRLSSRSIRLSSKIDLGDEGELLLAGDAKKDN